MESMSTSLRELCLQLTNACPLRCIHCSTRAGVKEHNELTLHEILDVISDFAGLGGRILELSGGEPIAFPDLREVMRHGNSLGLEIRVYTSGVERFSGGIARAPPKAFWEYLQSDGLAKIFLNLQGPDSVAHESITRIPGSFSAALESLRHAKDAGLFVGIHFVPMKPNFEQLADTARLTARCRRVRCSQIRCSRTRFRQQRFLDARF